MIVSPNCDLIYVSLYYIFQMKLKKSVVVLMFWALLIKSNKYVY